MERPRSVVKWERVSSALYAGALDNYNGTFSNTQAIIDYLHTYRVDPGIVRKPSDFYYHPENLKGPIGLSELFSEGACDRCRLCEKLSMSLEEGKFVYHNDHNHVDDSASSDPPDLIRLKHLAVLHTPYFLLLFLELVENKRYVLHTDTYDRHTLASWIYNVFKVDQSCFPQKLDFTFLMIWWRYQDRRSSRLLGISIPCYLEIHTGNGTWTPKLDSFANRKPDPLYSFISNKCLCYDIWPERATSYAKYADLSPNITTTGTSAQASTFAFRTMIPKLHSEAILDSLVRTYEDRGCRMCVTRDIECCTPVEPRLDCLVLEDVGHPKAAMMHILVTLHKNWQPLESWVSNAQHVDFAVLSKVATGVLGFLRHMCSKNERPPRQLYTEVHKLSDVFFVHVETGDVLSLLPYLSMNRLFRSSNYRRDEDSFRKACADLTLSILCAHKAQRPADRSALTQWWQSTSEELERINQEFVDSKHLWGEQRGLIWDALKLCKTGLVDTKLWSKLKPYEYGSRRMDEVDVADVWLGEDSRTIDTLVSKLVGINFRKPLRVSVIETIDQVDIFTIDGGVSRTVAPEIHKGLVNAVTLPAATPNTDTVCPTDEQHPVCDDVSEPHDRRCKRSHEIEESETTCKKVYNARHDFESMSLVNTQWEHEWAGPGDYSTPLTSEIYADVHEEELLSCEFSLSKIGNPSDADVHSTPHNKHNEDPRHETFCNNHNENMYLIQNETRSTTDSLEAERSAGPEMYINYDTIEGDADDFASFDEKAKELFRLFDNKGNVETPRYEYYVATAAEHESDRLQVNQELGPRVDHEILEEQREALVNQGNLTVDYQHMGCDVHIPQEQVPYIGELASYISMPRPCCNVNDADVTDRQSTPSDKAFLKANSRWKSNGFLIKLVRASYQLYETMSFKTPGEFKTWAELIVTTKDPSPLPISSPCQGLEIPKSMPSQLNEVPPDNLVKRVADRDNKRNWSLGVEISECKAHASKPLQCPKMIYDYTLRVTRQIWSSKYTAHRYRAVDLSKTPELGFVHHELIANDFPVGEDLRDALKIHSTQPSYLGAVCTIQDAQGLLVHRVFAITKTLEVILDMHTRIQVNTFVPRTFALHLVKTPFTDTEAVGVFVGEAVGEWHLGWSHGMLTMSQRDKYVLAYHVIKCLLKAQLLMLNTLGFTLGCIQPARIWKHESEFRLDFIGCLVDTIFNLQNRIPDVIPDIKLGLVAIRNTLLQLGLEADVPRALSQYLEESDDREWGDSVFSQMYELLTGESVEGHWFILGSCPRYESFMLETTHTMTEPYGPFRVQIHNQHTKWNKVTLVHPIQHVPLPMAHMSDKATASTSVNTQKQHPTRVRKVGNRRGHVCDNYTLQPSRNVPSNPEDRDLTFDNAVMSVSSVYHQI